MRWMIASEDAKNPLKARKQKGVQGYGPAISVYKEGMIWWNKGSLRRHKCNVRRNSIQAKPRIYRLYTPFYQGWRRVGDEVC
ncbi:MAG: hypothetical protein CL920_19565 [Deltaproteobacteria bacterium]|nr:hypothetical protein [Deltaproteobacteria bacterium]